MLKVQEYMPLEECGNMVITTLAYAQRTQDTSYLTQHYNILKQWTGYLVQEALIPADQLSTDDFQGQLANQTNLALKGIIAIQAMSEIASKTGNSADATNYSNIAHDYIGKWQQMAVVTDANPPHTNLDYNDDSSHGKCNEISEIKNKLTCAKDFSTTSTQTVFSASTSFHNLSTTCKAHSTRP